MDYSEKSDLKRSIWQYCIDHSKIQPNGYLGIMFYCKDQEDFWRRVRARQAGFQRYDIEDKEAGQIQIAELYSNYRWHQNHDKLRSERIEVIKNGNLMQKTAWYIYRKIKKYLAI